MSRSLTTTLLASQQSPPPLPPKRQRPIGPEGLGAARQLEATIPRTAIPDTPPSCFNPPEEYGLSLPLGWGCTITMTATQLCFPPNTSLAAGVTYYPLRHSLGSPWGLPKLHSTATTTIPWVEGHQEGQAGSSLPSVKAPSPSEAALIIWSLIAHLSKPHGAVACPWSREKDKNSTILQEPRPLIMTFWL